LIPSETLEDVGCLGHHVVWFWVPKVGFTIMGPPKKLYELKFSTPKTYPTGINEGRVKISKRTGEMHQFTTTSLRMSAPEKTAAANILLVSREISGLLHPTLSLTHRIDPPRNYRGSSYDTNEEENDALL